MTMQSRVHSRSRGILGLRLAAVCLGIVLSLLVLHGRVSADEAWRAQSVPAPAVPSPGARDLRQEPIVEVEVDVRSEGDVALLQSRGYSCDVGVCKLELPDGEELALIELGLPVRVMARAIKIVAEKPRSAASGEKYVYGANQTDVDIPDPFMAPCSSAYSYIDISGAPAGATVTRVALTSRVWHPQVSELHIGLAVYPLGAPVFFWWRNGGTTDGGFDDDPEDDNDVYLQRETTLFSGSWQSPLVRLSPDGRRRLAARTNEPLAVRLPNPIECGWQTRTRAPRPQSPRSVSSRWRRCSSR